ncbi:MAG: 8-oxoguanine DNA glycosylase [Clostridia bacterium]|nr:8-oxoguanine DNA glycosylase [Clostridia bacterium]
MAEIKAVKSKYIDNAIDIHNVCDFNLKHIFECGQCFRWNPYNSGYIGIAGDNPAIVYYELEQKNVLTIQSGFTPDTVDFWIDYFDLRRDYSLIKKELSHIDKYLKASVEFGYGIRILNQDPFETLISFILSANNNIPRIKGCVEKISETYGNKTEFGLYTFPSAEALLNISAEQISDCCHAGYRCAYIENSVTKYFENPINLDILKNLSLSDAENYLREFSGVGPKVADCILLFTGAHCDAFPVDVWVKRVMEELYLKKTSTLKEINDFAEKHFGKLSGFAQQYLFYFAREHLEDLRNIM